MANKLTLELELPTDLSDKEEAECFIGKQLEYAVQVLKDQLLYFKEQGIVVPAISIRNPSKKKKEVDSNFTDFKTKLIDLVLKYQPKIDVAPQMRVIKELYAFDKPAEHWIDLFEESRREYAATTWYTVKYRLSKSVDAAQTEEQAQFVRKEMDKEEINSLLERLRKEVKPSGG